MDVDINIDTDVNINIDCPMLQKMAFLLYNALDKWMDNQKKRGLLIFFAKNHEGKKEILFRLDYLETIYVCKI